MAAQRKPGQHLAGYWEFPGGKVEAGETEEQCLVRELAEELGIVAAIDSFFGESVHDYGEKVVKLRAYLVTSDCTEFHCRDHARLVWLPPSQLVTLQWAPADLPFVRRLMQSVQP